MLHLRFAYLFRQFSFAYLMSFDPLHRLLVRQTLLLLMLGFRAPIHEAELHPGALVAWSGGEADNQRNTEKQRIHTQLPVTVEEW